MLIKSLVFLDMCFNFYTENKYLPTIRSCEHLSEVKSPRVEQGFFYSYPLKMDLKTVSDLSAFFFLQGNSESEHILHAQNQIVAQSATLIFQN